MKMRETRARCVRLGRSVTRYEKISQTVPYIYYPVSDSANKYNCCLGVNLLAVLLRSGIIGLGLSLGLELFVLLLVLRL